MNQIDRESFRAGIAGGLWAALVERLEALAGPDRAVDVELAKLFGREHGVRTDHEMPRSYVTYETALAYTASFENAIKLIPDDHTVYLTRPTNKQPYAAQRRSAACAAPPGMGGPQNSKRRCHLFAYGATPAIALCIAALKARNASVAPQGKPQAE